MSESDAPTAPSMAPVHFPTSPTPAADARLRVFVFALFFVFGGITSLNDVVIPKLKGLFTLSYAEAMLVQSAFFAAYFLVSIPAALIVERLGYMRTAVLGLLCMTAGCLLFVPASASGRFAVFLAALFVLASGITVVQVVANPLIALLGSAATAHSRLTFAQAFNSLGTTIFPYVGAVLILGSTGAAALGIDRALQTRVIVHAYLWLAGALTVLALLVWRRRDRLAEVPAATRGMLRTFDLLKRARFAAGASCIFLYVGAEVAIGSLLVSYLVQPGVWDTTPEIAGKHVSFYWGGAMVGRFIGAYVLRVAAPGKVLAVAAGVAIALLIVSANTSGSVCGWSLLAVGLFNSIMFPTIFTLASEGLGRRAAEGSGIICMAIVGGALLPLATGHAADLVGLKAALGIPGLCYAGILGFGLYARRPLAAAGEDA
jgi:FHS family L-fucose permease-like MFS transporter